MFLIMLLLDALKFRQRKNMELEKIIESIQSTINSNDLTEFSNDYAAVVKELSAAGEQFTSETISAAILKMYVDFKNKEAEKKAKQDAKAAAEVAKAEKESNIQRFFINVGMMDNLDKDSLKKLIMDNVPEIKDTDFNDVYLKDTFSFFELPKNFSDDVLAKVAGNKIGDREINVELSEKRERSSSRGGRSFGRGGRGGDRGGRSHDYRRSEHRDYDGGHEENHGFAGRGGERSYRSDDDNGRSRSYSHHDDNRGYRSHDDSHSYHSRSNDSYQGADYSHENPGSYTESKKGR